MCCQFLFSWGKRLRAGPQEQPFQKWWMDPRLWGWPADPGAATSTQPFRGTAYRGPGDFLLPRIKPSEGRSKDLGGRTRFHNWAIPTGPPSFPADPLFGQCFLNSVWGQVDLVVASVPLCRYSRSWKTKGWSGPGGPPGWCHLVRGWLNPKSFKIWKLSLFLKTRKN